MAKRNKLQKFSELLTFPNVLESPDAKNPAIRDLMGNVVPIKGRWKAHFGNEKPITVELACGRGEYALAMARAYPDRNFIGVDIKGARIWKGARMALAEKLENVAFLRTRIEQIDHFFAPGEVDEIWITFPDPFLRKSKKNRRLTSIPFLKRYQKIIKPSGLLHLKTDDPTLYDFSVESITTASEYQLLYKSEDIYAEAEIRPDWEIKTYYEAMHLDAGKTIKYILWRFEGAAPSPS